MTTISVFGLGYVGSVSAACFARDGFHVIGVDVNPQKVDAINAGRATIVEEGIAELTAQVHAEGRLSATTSAHDAVTRSQVSMVCVGTPSLPNGALNLQYVERVCEQIGCALPSATGRHTVVIRSTMLPGSTDEVVRPALERSSGMRAGEDFDLCFNPEFLREGSSIRDFYDPPFTVIGCSDRAAADRALELYRGVNAPRHVIDIRAAEMLKYACNCFHALKVSFANEIGTISKALGIDSHQVMKIFCEDTKLNVSPAYLRPGFAYGGSCLPKDLRALTYRAKTLDLATPLLLATAESNAQQIARALELVLAQGHRDIGILGLAFKEGTDDLRESPMVSLIETLIGKGYRVRVYDPEVNKTTLIGANRASIEQSIPHIWTLLRPSIDDVLQESRTIVVGNKSREFQAIESRLGEQHVVVDLVRAFGDRRSDGTRYHGLCW